MITNPNTIPSTYPILVDGVYFLMIPYRFWPDSHGCKNFSLVLVFEIGVPSFRVSEVQNARRFYVWHLFNGF